MQQEGANYFANQNAEEESPIIIDPETSIKYYNLEKIFNSFFPEDSLSIAKDKSIKERDSKHINDSSFTYGEIVNNNNIYFFLDFQINGIHFRIHKSRI